MLKNYLKIFVRNLWKHIGYSISNISGLAVGMTACFLILLFVRYELNWNDSNKNYDRIYRIQQKVLLKNDYSIYSQTGFQLAPELKNQIPEIDIASTTARIWDEYLSSSDKLTFNEKEGYYADDNIFKIFTYEFIQGNSESALSSPYSIVISKKIAKKYFHDENPLGKIIKSSLNHDLKITGVYKDILFNNVVRPDYIVSLSTYREIASWKEFEKLENIDAGIFYTYVLLKPNVSTDLINTKIYNFFEKYNNNNFKKLYLKPLSELHLAADETNDIKTGLYYIGGFAIFVLALACINFINVSTSNSYLRRKEIGVRKIVGASRFALIIQFIAESILISFIAIVMTFLLVAILLPEFNAVVQRQMEISLNHDFKFIMLIIFAFLITGFLSGLYPALYLSGFRALQVIKGNVSLFSKPHTGSSKSFLRKLLVGFQCCISITLLISTIYVVKQVKFMNNKDLGFEKQNLLVCKIFGKNDAGRFETLRNELMSNSNIVEATQSINAPFYGNFGKEINWEGAAPNEKIVINYNAVDCNFIDTYKMKMVLGRNFSTQFPTDSKACIINETAWEKLGWKDPLGKKIDNNKFTIIGVVKDFHPYTVHEKIPAYYMTLNSGGLKESGIFGIRINPGNKEKTTEFINDQFRKFFPNAIIEVNDFDNDIDFGTKGLWETAEKIFIGFAIISVLIAANGLFSMISFASQRKMKEVGIRKVFGANSSQIYLLMSKEFIYILILAAFMALPAGYFITHITPGAYKYQMQSSDYLTGIGLMIITAVIASVYHTTKAVLSNPVEILKYE